MWKLTWDSAQSDTTHSLPVHIISRYSLAGRPASAAILSYVAPGY